MAHLNTTIWWLLRAFFCVLMLATGATKALDMPGFAEVVASYQSLPGWFIMPGAWLLMLSELVLGVWLLIGPRFGLRVTPAALAIVAMHLMYLGWLIVAYARGLDLPNCGCFGVYWPRPLTWVTLVEDSVLLVGAGAFFMLTRRRESDGGGWLGLLRA